MPSSVPPQAAQPKFRAFPDEGRAPPRFLGTTPGSASLRPALAFGSPPYTVPLLPLARPPQTADGRASPLDRISCRTCHDLYAGRCRSRSRFQRPAAGFALLSRARHLQPFPISARQSAALFRSLYGCHLLEASNVTLRPRSLLRTPATCYRASWPLPWRNSHPLEIRPFLGTREGWGGGPFSNGPSCRAKPPDALRHRLTGSWLLRKWTPSQPSPTRGGTDRLFLRDPLPGPPCKREGGN